MNCNKCDRTLQGLTTNLFVGKHCFKQSFTSVGTVSNPLLSVIMTVMLCIGEMVIVSISANGVKFHFMVSPNSGIAKWFLCLQNVTGHSTWAY